MWWPRKFALLAVGGIALVLGLLVTTMCVSLGESPHCGVRSGFRGDRHRLEAALEGHGVTALASYPRSGNSLTRLLLERVTGVWTGSVYLDEGLLRKGWLGEGRTSPVDVIFVKTHEPLRFDGAAQLPAYARAVYVVRNPLDAIWSYFNFALTDMQHDRSVDIALINQQSWKGHVIRETVAWVKHIQHWQNVSLYIPTHFVRYEDLMTSSEATLLGVLDFVFEGGRRRDDDVKRSEIIQEMYDRIGCAVKSSIGRQRVGGYQPRQQADSAAMFVFSPEQVDFVLRASVHELCQLGYDDWLRAYTDRYTCDNLPPQVDLDRLLIASNFGT